MEKGHLHNGVDARAKAALTGDFRRVNHKSAPAFDSARPVLPGAGGTIPHQRCRGIEQENAAGLQPLYHLIFIDKLQLVAADEIGLRDQIRRADRFSLTRRCETVRPPAFFES